MRINKILMIGCGRLGTLTARMLQQHSYQVVGTRRSIANIPKDISGLQLDLNDLSSISQLPTDWSVIIVAVTAKKPSEEAYTKTYFEGVKNLLTHLKAKNVGEAAYKPLILFVSSTSVYGQNDGSLIDESSETAPQGFSGKVLLKIEQLLEASEFPSCAVRFTGIYGSSSDHMIDKLMRGEIYSATPKKYSNRIHIEDCARMLLHLIKRYEEQGEKTIAPCYIGVDYGEVTVREMMEWLAHKKGIDVGGLCEIPAPSRGGNKRCSNALICSQGFEFKYRDFRAGY